VAVNSPRKQGKAAFNQDKRKQAVATTVLALLESLKSRREKVPGDTNALANELDHLWRRDALSFQAWPSSHSPDGVLLDASKTVRETGSLTLFGKAYLLPFVCLPLELEVSLTLEEQPASLRLRLGSEKHPWTLTRGVSNSPQSGVRSHRVWLHWELSEDLEQRAVCPLSASSDRITRALLEGRAPSEILGELKQEGLSNDILLASLKQALGCPFHAFDVLRTLLQVHGLENRQALDMEIWNLLSISENVA
jgi:hypothetical protein